MKELLIALVAACALAACGGQSPSQQAASAVVGFDEALRDGRQADACQRTTDPRGCMELLAEARTLGDGGFLPGRLPSAAQVRSESVQVNGDRARVGSGPDTVQLVRRGGRWLIDMS
jgi:hypothetical protein